MSPHAGAQAATRLTEARRSLPPGAIELACHAALPVVIDPTFLNLLRINFFVDPPNDLPWTVEADLLASPLFRELGGELYEIDEDLRRSLLVSLRTRYGGERVEQVALLLERYGDQPGVWGGHPYLARAQQLTVVGILDPAAAVGWLDDIQADGASPVELSPDWIVAMRGRLSAQPAPDVTLDDEIAEAAARLRSGDPAAHGVLTTLGLLPGSDPEAVRSAREAAAAPQSSEPLPPQEIDFGHHFPLLNLDWGVRGQDAPLPLSGAVLQPSLNNKTEVQMYVALDNHGRQVYASILEIDPLLRVTLTNPTSPQGVLVEEASRRTMMWRPSFEAAKEEPREYFHLLTRGEVPFRLIAVISDVPIDLAPLSGQSVSLPEPAPEDIGDPLTNELKNLMANHGSWSGRVQVALTKIDYSVRISPISEIPPVIQDRQEAVDRQRRRVLEDREAGLPNLATSLSALGSALAANGRYGEAVTAGEEAVSLRRELIDRDPAELAGALTDFSRYLAATGRHSEAIATNAEAVGWRRQLFQQSQSDLDRALLAAALDDQSRLLAAVSRYEEALFINEEAVSLYRLLRSSRPELATALNIRTQLLASVRRPAEALNDSLEAVSIFQNLADENPEPYSPDLALSLTNLSRILEAVGQLTEALQASKEATHIYRDLSQADSDAYSPALASALTGYSRLLGAAGRVLEARGFGEEAVAEQRRTVRSKGSAQFPGLAAALSNLSRLLARAGQVQEALILSTEAVGLYRKVNNSAAVAAELEHVESLFTASGRSSEAAAARSEAAALRLKSGDGPNMGVLRRAYPDTSRDAVVFIPGIGGSELVETSSGRVLWGSPTANVVRLARGSAERMLVTDEDRAGDSDRIRATRLIRSGVVLPGLFDLNPYSRLLAEMGSSVVHPDALLAFAYDWRLSAAHNAKRLREVAESHLARWRAHPSGGPEAKLTIVAHSFGGLVALNYLTALDGAHLTRRFLAIGTPFYGAVTAVTSLARHGDSRRVLGLRQLYQSMPAMYDMLPAYRCVQTTGDLRRLTVVDVMAIGGSGEFAADVFRRRPDLQESSALLAAAGTEVTTVVGVGQPTPQSFRVDEGVVTTFDGSGDGVVYDEAATFPGTAAPTVVSQRAGTLPGSREVSTFIRAFLSQAPAGPPL
ncbi:tetratricopeptide repeat protein [Actinoplanes sp. CA-054009]